MSFEVICSNCGAPSGPSVGICPFCKSMMGSANGKNGIQDRSIESMYETGRLDTALGLAKNKYNTDENAKKDLSFLLLFVKILLDAEAPSVFIRGVLAQGLLIAPSSTDVLDYIDIVEAKSFLKKGIGDAGEKQVRNVLRRSPNSVHAHFLLGTHLFWAENQPQQAIPHLETVVRLSPTNLRAWGCLGAIYKKLNNPALALRAFQKCSELETNPSMKEFFLEEVKALS